MKIKGFKDTIEWYNQNAKRYAQKTIQAASLDEIDQFVNLLPKEAKVLDAGCGSGRDTNLLTNKGLKVIGLDLSSGLIKVARKNYPNLEFVDGRFSVKSQQIFPIFYKVRSPKLTSAVRI